MSRPHGRPRARHSVVYSLGRTGRKRQKTVESDGPAVDLSATGPLRFAASPKACFYCFHGRDVALGLCYADAMDLRSTPLERAFQLAKSRPNCAIVDHAPRRRGD
jgi:hypothetical protein